MYLWQVLRRDTDELDTKVNDTQQLNSCKGDWYSIMQEERNKYGIEESDDQISKLSDQKFRNILSKRKKLVKNSISMTKGCQKKMYNYFSN